MTHLLVIRAAVPISQCVCSPVGMCVCVGPDKAKEVLNYPVKMLMHILAQIHTRIGNILHVSARNRLYFHSCLRVICLHVDIRHAHRWMC